MLHILESTSTRPGSDHVLASMFAARKAVFVDLLKWDVPVLAGRYEIDQFDDPHATYIVLTDASGAHLGSARLLPTTRPHILADLYPDLCDEAPPREEDIYEITRFCLDRRLKARERRKIRDTLVTALVDHALITGIGAYTALAELGWYQQILAFGWRCVPLGLPKTIAASTLAAFRIEIEQDTPARLIAAGILAHAALASPERRAAA